MIGATGWLHEATIRADLRRARLDAGDPARLEDVLAKARTLAGLAPAEAALLCAADDPESRARIHAAAGEVKQAVYGRRLVLFTPLYVSNLCANDCAYCAFRAGNHGIVRRALDADEIRAETAALVDEGHRRILLVAGEAYPREGFDYVLNAIDAVYSVTREKGAVRRVNVNVAPLETEDFRRLRDRRIGTYQIFQETYDRSVYAHVHRRGRKRDFDWRLAAMDRAMTAGVDDVGVGVLFGLADWRFEVLALLQHARHLEAAFGVGPHTVSVPRLEPATGSDLASHPPHAVSDDDFKTLVAVLRLAVPWTGIIMSTRETARIRRETFALGVSQISAGSRTSPGGYTSGDAEPQFSLGDHRPLDEVVRDVASLGYIPSFCTGCYRLGRTGADFMDLARPGLIREHCDPNGLTSFLEYLQDHASSETRSVGEARIAAELAAMDPERRRRAASMLDRVRAGRRDVYC
ncbi:MAG TPA: [FeFe] hydrogenase H-cluster radical SAM maturase HydG [Candidatus Krumholzibacteria bacterium]|nr:[FeFe] hydrogenase H-cluster radical SAM maturase HydG [Candidatus Krumholzibacteria bacterium]HRX52447.1 [FeFe] hydrogenase H-cluster radical SAM maturase HydG [Candidatus Krumholzibacteria bacterium]